MGDDDLYQSMRIDNTVGPLTRAVDTGPDPCRQCHNIPICRTGMACQQYRVFVNTGVILLHLSKTPTCRGGF